MARTFLLTVALLLIFALTEASGGQTNQDGQKVQSRGSTRFHSRSTTESSSFSASSIRPPRDKDSHSEAVSDLEKHEIHPARESSIRSRSKLQPSRTVELINDSSDATPRTSARHLSSGADILRNRSKTQSFKGDITKSRQDDNKENVPELQTPKRQTASRRIPSSTPSSTLESGKRLDHEVFTKSPGRFRSRTGRKIYTNRNEKEQATISEKTPVQNVEDIKRNNRSEKQEAQSQSERSRSFESVVTKMNASRRMDTQSADNSTDDKDRIKEQDVLLSGSESIRVDIPLTVETNESAAPSLSASATTSSINVSPRETSRPFKEKVESNDIAKSSAKKSRQSDYQSKSRGRSNVNDPNIEITNSRGTSRRGSSKSSNAAANRRPSNSRNRSNAKSVSSRDRSVHKSGDIATGGRDKKRKNDAGIGANRQTETRRNSSNDKRKSEAKRRSNDGRLKPRAEEQETRTQSRSRLRAASLDITTAYIPKATIAETTTVSSVEAELTTSSSASSITSTMITRTSPSTDRASRSKERDRGESSRSKKPPKEDFFNHGLGFRGRKSSTEIRSANVTELRTTTSKSETQLRGNPGWTLKRRPSHVNHDASLTTTITPVNRDQTNEIISPNDTSRGTEASSNSVKGGRRGSKRPKAKDESNAVSSIAAKGVIRGSKTFNKSESYALPKGKEVEESDNYPPAFRARLSQLFQKNANSKFTGGKGTTTTSFQATKASTPTLFSERSKLKLDLARRLIKPELSVDENDFDVTTVPYSGKSKLRETSTTSESRNVEKTTKATKSNDSRITHRGSISEGTQREKSGPRGRWKIAETRKSVKDRDLGVTARLPVTKKIRVASEKTIAPSFSERRSTKSVTELNAIPRGISILHRGIVSAEETAATTVGTMKIRSPMSQTTTISREDTSTFVNTVRGLDADITTVEPMKLDKVSSEIKSITDQPREDVRRETTTISGVISLANTLMESTAGIYTTEYTQEVTLLPTVTTSSNTHSSATKPGKLYPVYVPGNHDPSTDAEKEDATKNGFRPRYAKQQESDRMAISMVTTRTVGPTSRYIRKKSGVFTPYDVVPKTFSTETTPTQTKRREFRPRTATYRRHSEIPTSSVQSTSSVRSTTSLATDPTTRGETASVTITPKPTKYHSSVRSSTPSTRSTEPFVSVRIDTSNDTTPRGSSIGNNNGSSNIFNPTKSAFLAVGNTTTLLEQVRSTVAPLLNNLGNRSPVFSGAYSNVDTGNSAPRITPNGSPPRFSARYKGAELLVRRPSFGQPVVPSLTTSSTTASTPIETSGLAPPIDIVSPGEPRFVTFYQALETASIRNENLGADDSSQQRKLTGVTKVDSNAVLNDGNANNDTASPVASIAPTSSPDSIVDTTTTLSADISLASRLGTGNTPGDTSSIAPTTAPIPSNPDSNVKTSSVVNDDEMTSVPTSATPGITDDTITNTSVNVDAPSTSEPLVTTEDSTSMPSKIMSSTESNDAGLTETANMNTERTTETASPMNTEIPTTTSQSPQSDIPGTTISSSTPESIMMTQIPSKIAVLSAISENIETNAIQRSDDMTTSRAIDAPIDETSDGVEMSTTQQPGVTLPQTTKVAINGEVENIETNIIQQDDVTTSQTTETTSTANIETSTTQKISDELVVIQATQIPIFSSTSRTRLIDYAQDILSRLQVDLPVPYNKPIQQTVSTTVSYKLPNADLSLTKTKSLLRTDETTTMRGTGSGSVETTDRNIDSTQTMLSATMDSNTEQRSSNIVEERNATLLDLASTTESSTTDAEVTTAATMSIPRDFVTAEEPSSSNDTLLAELMTIAKTLFSEAMNETQQTSTLTQVSDIETTTVPQTYNLIRANDTIENIKTNPPASSDDATSTSFKFPVSLESTSERVDTTTSIDFPGNETGENSSPIIESTISLINARPIAVENSVDVDDVTSVMPEMSLSQTETQTPNAITPVTVSMNSQPTTNTTDSQPANITLTSDNTGQQTIPGVDSAQRDQIVPNKNIELINQSSGSAMDSNDLPIANIITNMEKMLPDTNEFATSDMPNETVTEATSSVITTEVNANAENSTINNQTPEPVTVESTSDPRVITRDQSLVTDPSVITTTLPTVFDVNVPDMNDTQSSSTEPSAESIRDPVDSTDTTTNQFNDITTNVPRLTSSDLTSENPNFIARFQDTTATTAQGTAGSSMIETEPTTEIIIPTTSSSSASMPNDPSASLQSSAITTVSPSSAKPTVATTTTIDATMTTTTMTSETTLTDSSSQADGTVGPMSEMTTTTIDINENLVSTETSTDTTTTQDTTAMAPTESEDLNMISRMDGGEEQTTTTTSTASITTTSITPSVVDGMTTRPAFASFGPLNAISFLGPYGGSQMTPAPRFRPSGKTPVRDYLIYGIYPNKTIVRKRPEDNLIDARNVDSPYVIFGIYPDGRLVRKFPNGTVIPDSPRNPVEVVFTLRTTTTTNRPAPRPYYNQANQAGIYNQYQAPVYDNRRPQLDELTRNAQRPSPVDTGLTGNAIGVPLGDGPYFAEPFGTLGSVPDKMSDTLLNTQLNTLPNIASTIGNVQTPFRGNVQVQSPIGPIIQDRDRTEASQTRTTSNQHSSVYIGQDKFINYQINGTPDINPKVVDLKINSVATSLNEGTASSTASLPSFENLLSNQPGGVITAPPGFPWRDPLDQIFGITTNSPIQTASVASNQLDEPIESNAPITSGPINPFVEVFTPMSNGIISTNTGGRLTASTSTTTNATPSITSTTVTPIPTTSTMTTTTAATTTAATTTAATTTAAITTAATTTAATTTAATTTAAAATITTTTTAPTTSATTTTSQSTTARSTTPRLATTASSIIVNSIPGAAIDSGRIASSPIATRSAMDILNELQTNTKDNPFGTTFGDLIFLNSLLQNGNIKTTTPKTLSEVEQMLANRILALALGNGPTRSPKAIQSANLDVNRNSINNLPSSAEPIIIDLLPYSSAPSQNAGAITSTTKRYVETSTTPRAAQPSTTPITTPRAQVVITAKPVTRPRTTTPAPVGFGTSLWRALFGGNLFETATAASTAKSTKQKPVTKAVTTKPASVTQKPVQIAKSTTYASHIMSAVPIKSHTTARSVDISDIQVSSPTRRSPAENVKYVSVTTPSLISTTRQTLLNNPNPRLNDISTSTYSPEDDAKFLAAVLRAVQTDSKTSSSNLPGISKDDEAFLRAILSNQITTTTTTTPSSTEVNPAALLALLLKQQGIEPSTPATKLREQLQSLNLDLNTLLPPNPSLTTTQSTTTTTNRPVFVSSILSSTTSTTRKPVTSRPKPQTTTWLPSSTYPPPLFGSFSNFGSSVGSTRGDNSGSGLITATRAFGQFLGAAITGAAQQLQSLLRNSTRNVAG